MAYLADPIANPIDIDAGITYNYVIPQQDYKEITVDDLTDFEFVVTLGSPASLTVNFTGTATALPQYFTATVRLFTIEALEQTQDLNFRVLPTSASQRVPNITTNRSLHASEGQQVNIKLQSDITATLSASGLTGGLSVANDRIVGTAPTSSGFNVFTLSAINGDYVYHRYFVLLVGTGGDPVSQSFFSFSAEVFP